MKIATYMCDKCNMMHEFPDEDRRNRYLCPNCNSEMWYFRSDEVDDEIDLVINTWEDDDREVQTSHIINQPTKPTITCPYCQSTNTKPISGIERTTSILGLGIFSKKINKSCKCLDCKCTW